MSNNMESIKVGSEYEKGSLSTTTTVILILLSLVILVMGYNYWTMYCLRNDVSRHESFSGTDSASESEVVQENSCVNNPDGTVCPTVKRVLENVSQYEVGHMSDELKQHYNAYNAYVRSPEMKQTEELRDTTDIKPLKTSDNAKPNQTVQKETVTKKEDKTNQPQTMTDKKNTSKSETPEKGVIKVIVYHMPGCGHCNAIMHRQRTGEKSHFEKLREIFESDNDVAVLDFQLGRDPEAGKFKFFPMIMIVTEQGPEEYRGPRDALNIAKAVIDKKN